jgi:hypothetical protein
MGPSLSTQITALALRSILRTVRQPAVIVSALLFPMMFFAIKPTGSTPPRASLASPPIRI